METPTNSTDEVKAELENARKESHDKIKLLEEKLAATEKEMRNSAGENRLGQGTRRPPGYVN